MAGCQAATTATNGDGGDPNDPTSCGAGVFAVADEGRVHVPSGTPVAYKHNPPASGSHWPDPYPWGVSLNTVAPRERWVHNLEHGGVVFLFNCGGASSDGGGGDGGMSSDGGAGQCPDVTAALQYLHDERKPDEFNEIRIAVTPDPLAPRRVTAVAWDWMWEGDAVDAATMRCFRDRRYGQGPEHAP